MDVQELSAHVAQQRAADILSAEVAHGELTVTVKPEALVGFLDWLKRDPVANFTSLVDITAIDHPERPDRFDMVYHFLSMHKTTASGSRPAWPTGRFIPRSVPSTRPRTGSSVKCSTCSASSFPTIPTCAAS